MMPDFGAIILPDCQKWANLPFQYNTCWKLDACKLRAYKASGDGVLFASKPVFIAVAYGRITGSE